MAIWIVVGIGGLVVFLGCLVVAIITSYLISTNNPSQESASSAVSTSVVDIDSLEQMVDVPAGEFEMGITENEINELLKTNPDKSRDMFLDSLPRHTVYLSGFSIDKYEVTNEMFSQFMTASGYKTDAEKDGWGEVFTGKEWSKTLGANWNHPRGPDSSIAGKEKYPVVQVTWADANAYCKWAGRRLPTEAEWEKAARGIDNRKFPWGNGDSSGTLLNFADKNTQVIGADSSIDDGYQFIAPVGSYPQGASPYGAMDMAGNVYEWIADWYGPTYYSYAPKENPMGPSTGTLRAKRGGAWCSRSVFVQSTYRDGFEPTYKGDDFGFRCVR
jgi:formylglycine-generating enzyme required for sulfatase activity